MFDIDEFVAECTAALTEPEPQLAVKEVVGRAIARPADIEARLGARDRGAS